MTDKQQEKIEFGYKGLGISEKGVIARSQKTALWILGGIAGFILALKLINKMPANQSNSQFV